MAALAVVIGAQPHLIRCHAADFKHKIQPNGAAHRPILHGLHKGGAIRHINAVFHFRVRGNAEWNELRAVAAGAAVGLMTEIRVNHNGIHVFREASEGPRHPATQQRSKQVSSKSVMERREAAAANDSYQNMKSMAVDLMA